MRQRQRQKLRPRRGCDGDVKAKTEGQAEGQADGQAEKQEQWFVTMNPHKKWNSGF